MAKDPNWRQHLKPAWKSGECGNPAGRPPSKPITSELMRILAETDPGTRKTLAEGLARAMVKKAHRGSVPAAEFVADRVEGKPVQMQAAIVAYLSPSEIADARELAAMLRGESLAPARDGNAEAIDATCVQDTTGESQVQS